jgi:hypothetical protein
MRPSLDFEVWLRQGANRLLAAGSRRESASRPAAICWTAGAATPTLARSMCLCTLCTERFLVAVAGSDELDAFRRRHGLPEKVAPRARIDAPAVARWVAAADALPGGGKERLARDQEAVLRLGSPLGAMHLLAAGGDPPAESFAPHLALGHLLDRPDLFWQVVRRHRRREADVWLAARVALGNPLADNQATAIRDVLGRFFDRPVRVVFHQMPTGAAFVAWESSTKATGATEVPLAQLVCYPHPGTLLFQAPSVPPGAARAALNDGVAALGATISPEEAFDLDRLVAWGRPLATADGVQLVRLRALGLNSPSCDGGHSLTLRSTAGDEGALERLLGDYVRPADLRRLRVSYAELHLRLSDGGAQRELIVRLWPGACGKYPKLRTHC